MKAEEENKREKEKDERGRNLHYSTKWTFF